MNSDYAAHLRPRGKPEIRCGHTDCCYYCRRTDSCDYLLMEGRRRPCPAEAGCACYAPPCALDLTQTERLELRIRLLGLGGYTLPMIAQRLGLSCQAVRQLRERRARRDFFAAERAGAGKGG